LSTRRRRKKGPVAPATSAFAPPLTRQMLPLFTLYGVPRSAMVRVSVPVASTIHFRISSADHLCGFEPVPPEVASKIIPLLPEPPQPGPVPQPKKKKHVFVEISNQGLQVIYHHPVSPIHSGGELDKTFAVDVNVIISDDERPHLEVQLAFQASRNYSFLDPNRSNPNETQAGRSATQEQLQLQLSYVIPKLFGVEDLSVGVFAQVAGARTYQFDPTLRTPTWSWQPSASGGVGIGAGYDFNDSVGLVGQGTLGPTFADHTTIDFGAMVLLKIKFGIF
jgi:hypothetical protein